MDKRRVTTALARYLFNPAARGLFKVGLAPPGTAQSKPELAMRTGPVRVCMHQGRKDLDRPARVAAGEMGHAEHEHGHRLIGDDTEDLPGLLSGQRRIGAQQAGRVGQGDVEGTGGRRRARDCLVRAGLVRAVRAGHA